MVIVADGDARRARGAETAFAISVTYGYAAAGGLCAVVERKSFSEAAERLGVTQPAVSQQIRSLEERLGQQLLDRSAGA